MGPKISFEWFSELVARYPDAETFRNEALAIYNYADSIEEQCNQLMDDNDRLVTRCRELEEMLSRDAQVERIVSLERQLSGRNSKQEFFLQYVVQLFDKASAYSNLIISAGFVGLFATWNLMRDNLTNAENRIVAACALFSLMIFAGWEVAKMVHAGITSNKLARIVLATSDEQFDAYQMRLRSYGDRWSRFFESAWVWILVATIAPGFFAGLVLVAAFVDGIFFRY
jgi:hypothetical protein